MLQKVTTAILMTDITCTNEVTVTVRGIGGIGKSTIAKAICHERSIKEHFTDGFLWISLTPPHNVTDELRKIYNRLTNQSIEGSLSFVKEKIKSLLMSTSYKLLVILDDVWKAQDAIAYIEIFQSCKTLLTTRKFLIHSEIQAKNYIDMKPMELNEALNLLTSRIDELKTLDGSAKAMICKLAEDLHCWPLLLNLVRSQLYIYCTEWKMSPEKAISHANEKLSKNLMAFDQGNRETAVKSCLDVSLNLLPEQDMRVLQCVVLTFGGFGSYALKDTVAKASKMTIEQFNMCVANLWSHGLIELVDIPVYPTNQCIPCIGVQDIVAHYIIETIPLERLYEMFGSIENFIGWDDFMKVYDEGDKFLENNVGTSLLYFIPNMLAYFIRLASILACLVEKLPSDSASNFQAVTDKMTTESIYSNMSKDCAAVVSLVMDNKHNDAIEWLNKHFKNHPLTSMSGNVFLNEECISVEEFAEIPAAARKMLTYFTILHRCVAVLTKVKASDEDIEYVMDCCMTAMSSLIDL